MKRFIGKHWEWFFAAMVALLVIGWIISWFNVNEAIAANEEFFSFRDVKEVYCAVWEEKPGDKKVRNQIYEDYWSQSFRCSPSIQEIIKWMNKQEQVFHWGELSGPSTSEKFLGIFKLEEVDLERKLKKLRLPYIEWGVKK